MIHPTAVIEKGAVLAEDITVGPYAVIERMVVLKRGVTVSAFAHLKGDTHIGENTFIGTGALIGEVPQILGCRQAGGKVYIGKNNVIREYVTIHTSSSQDKITSIGDNNYLMGFSHVAHDCNLKNNIIVCNGALIAGHVEVQDRAFISGDVVIHQFVRIGRLAMIGGLSRVNQDIPPFMMVVGDSRVWGLNIVGLRRAKFTSHDIAEIKKTFNILYRSHLPLKSALEKIKGIDSGLVKEVADFITPSKRGICGPQKSSLLEKIFLDYPYFLRTKIPTYRLFLKSRKRPI
ncbi:MAG: acyl-ACP--UDP-N-acetylglucosamine O-acyltransferase [Candidatus Omnitrophota bacterium]|nr:MAG: acyl-ACP--UDP-N-acetylglucosamine O-acyltransferase [Candidatus Omnitrophota bacterium]